MKLCLLYKRIYFDNLEDFFNNPKLTYKNPIENLAALYLLKIKIFRKWICKKINALYQ